MIECMQLQVQVSTNPTRLPEKPMLIKWRSILACVLEISHSSQPIHTSGMKTVVKQFYSAALSVPVSWQIFTWYLINSGWSKPWEVIFIWQLLYFTTPYLLSRQLATARLLNQVIFTTSQDAVGRPLMYVLLEISLVLGAFCSSRDLCSLLLSSFLHLCWFCSFLLFFLLFIFDMLLCVLLVGLLSSCCSLSVGTSVCSTLISILTCYSVLLSCAYMFESSGVVASQVVITLPWLYNMVSASAETKGCYHLKSFPCI